jgi:hypothetical protein
VWADNSPYWDFASTSPDQFNVRARGGVRFVSSVDDSGEPTAGVDLAPGGGSWSALSDWRQKANFRPIDAVGILNALVNMRIETWSYRSQDSSIRHIGPSAQDFSAAFGVGEDEKHISTVDADGVALAAIQALYALITEKDRQIQELRTRLSNIEDRQK